MAQLGTMTISVPGCELWIEYQQSNRRVQRVEWTIPPQGVVVRARVWDNGVLVVDRTEGQGSGSENIPGNYQLVEEVIDGVTELVLPSNITYSFQMQTIG